QPQVEPARVDKRLPGAGERPLIAGRSGRLDLLADGDRLSAPRHSALHGLGRDVHAGQDAPDQAGREGISPGEAEAAEQLLDTAGHPLSGSQAEHVLAGAVPAATVGTAKAARPEPDPPHEQQQRASAPRRCEWEAAATTGKALRLGVSNDGLGMLLD